MGRTAHDVTEAELAVLEVLWRHGAATMRYLAGQLYNDEGPSACATVQKLLTRLVAKKIVARSAKESPIRFRPTIDRDELIARRLRETAQRLCDGSLTPLLTQLVKSTPFSDSDRQKMLALIDKLDERDAPDDGER